MQEPTEERERYGHARKDRTRWCGGHIGREHQPETVIPPNHPGWAGKCAPPPKWFQNTPRYERMSTKPTWWCVHRVVCSVCGKVLSRSIPARDCPDRKGSDEQRDR